MTAVSAMRVRTYAPSLPFPDVEGCLAEIDFALDHLHADGFGIALDPVVCGRIVLGPTILKSKRNLAASCSNHHQPDVAVETRLSYRPDLG